VYEKLHFLEGMPLWEVILKPDVREGSWRPDVYMLQDVAWDRPFGMWYLRKSPLLCKPTAGGIFSLIAAMF